MTEATVIILDKKLDIADLAGDKVMVDFDTGKYYLLKGAANDIWDHIQTDITLGALVDKLLEAYDIDRAGCLASTTTFLQDLADNGFILLKD